MELLKAHGNVNRMLMDSLSATPCEGGRRSEMHVRGIHTSAASGNPARFWHVACEGRKREKLNKPIRAIQMAVESAKRANTGHLGAVQVTPKILYRPS